MSKPTNKVIDRYKKKTYKTVAVTTLKRELVEEWEQQLIKDGLTKAEFVRTAIEKYLGK